MQSKTQTAQSGNLHAHQTCRCKRTTNQRKRLWIT